jgi:6-phosphofructo-2-kinase
VFSVGNYRRQRLGTMPNDFFSPGKPEFFSLAFFIAFLLCGFERKRDRAVWEPRQREPNVQPLATSQKKIIEINFIPLFFFFLWVTCGPFTQNCLLANEDTKEQRLLIAEACLKDMIEWLERGGQVGIYDASNTTDERRAWIQRKLKEHDIQTLFIGKLHLNIPPPRVKVHKKKFNHKPFRVDLQ